MKEKTMQKIYLVWRVHGSKAILVGVVEDDWSQAMEVAENTHDHFPDDQIGIQPCDLGDYDEEGMYRAYECDFLKQGSDHAED